MVRFGYIQEIIYTLGNGYELYIIPSEVKRSLAALIRFVDENKIDQIFLSTALLEPFCEAALLISPRLEYLTDIFVSGEALKISHVIRAFFEHYLEIRLTNQYGPTETHVVSAYQLPKDSASWPEFPSIGLPIDNTELYVLDDKLQILPIGIPGELYIGGIGLARHYIDSTKEASNKFVSNPFGTDPNMRLYRTGDRVKWRTDGQLEFINRIDEQVKIRGHRVELREVEIAVLKAPDIRQCIVLAEPNHMNTLQLNCYMVAGIKTLEVTALKAFLSEILPNYMIPTQFFYVEEFPLTLNGKIDKQALSKHKLNVVCHSSSSAPRNRYDRELIGLWKQILNVNDCGINDDFFALGGHSLSVLRLLLMIENKFNLALSIHDFWSTPTIEKLSDKLMQRQANQFLDQSKLIEYENQQLPWPIVPLKIEGKNTPIFFIHPVGGTLFWFVDLVGNLGSERSVYGIQDPSIVNEKLLFNSIEEMAAFYLYCMKQIQATGPYLIAGASFGATVAFEIARQLETKGERADFVGLLDGWAYYPKELQKKNKFQKLMRLENEQLYKDFQVNQLKNHEKWQELQWHRNELLWKYSFAHLKTKLTLFKSKDLLSEFNWINDPTNYWHDYSVQPIEVHIVPGNHETMFKEPNVKTLAKCIDTCLQQNFTMVCKLKSEEHDY